MSDYAVTLSPAVGRQEDDAAREPSDEQVLEAVGRGDDDALGVLYDRFGRPAFRLAFRILRDRALAEDAVQEAFLAVWRSADAYKRERAKPSTWILTVVHRRAVDLVRREQTRRGEPLEAAPEPTSGPADEDAVLRDRRAAVQAALTELPGEQRQALELAYYGGLTQSELAERLGVPLGTVKSRMFAGLGRLRELLAEPEKRAASRCQARRHGRKRQYDQRPAARTPRRTVGKGRVSVPGTETRPEATVRSAPCSTCRTP